MIRLQELPSGRLLLISTVTDFSDSMGFCQHRIKLYLEGVKPPQTQVTIEGTESHEKAMEYEKKHAKFIPVTKEDLADPTKDIEFLLEAVYTRLFTEIEYGNEKLPILMIGQADKVMRKNGKLIVEDAKFPWDTKKFMDRIEPFEDQKLQVLTYLNSYFSSTDSLDPKDWFTIPHTEKEWVVNIKEKEKRTTVKSFRGTQTEEDKLFLEETLRKFALVALGRIQPENHNSARKCQSCRLSEGCSSKVK